MPALESLESVVCLCFPSPFSFAVLQYNYIQTLCQNPLQPSLLINNTWTCLLFLIYLITSAHTGPAGAQPPPCMSNSPHSSSQALEPSPRAMCIVNPSRCFPTGKAATAWLWWGPATFRTTVLISFCVHPTAPFIISLCSKSSSGRLQLWQTWRKAAHKHVQRKKDKKTINLSVRNATITSMCFLQPLAPNRWEEQ